MDGNNEEPLAGDVRNRPSTSKNDNSTSTQSSSASDSSRQELSKNSEYCKQLESWLWKCYWHRTIAVSAYFTALNQHYGNGSGGSHPQQAQTQQVRQVPAFRINFNVFANQCKLELSWHWQ